MEGLTRFPFGIWEPVSESFIAKFDKFEFLNCAGVICPTGVFLLEVGCLAFQNQGRRECVPAEGPGAGDGVVAGGEVLAFKAPVGVEGKVANTGRAAPDAQQLLLQGCQFAPFEVAAGWVAETLCTGAVANDPVTGAVAI